MGQIKFVQASKEQSRLRLALYGIAGTGKTYSSLALATGIQQVNPDSRIAVIDSERRTASKYADRFKFLTLNLEKRTIPEYLAAIQAAREAGLEILILDSISHAWKWLVKEVDRIAKAKYKSNTFAAWREGDLIQDEFIDAILDYPGHVIATMRSRTEWAVQKSGDKSAPQRVGTAPDQGKDIEFEFDMLMEFGSDHIANVIKDRSSRYQDKPYEKPGIELGKELAEWLKEGEHPSRPWLREQFAAGTPFLKLNSQWEAGHKNGRIPEEDFLWGIEKLQEQAALAQKSTKEEFSLEEPVEVPA